jgi:16S rRNA (guanine527-N7)-methyltransferase
MTPDAIQSLLAEQAGLSVDREMAARLAQYLELLLRWNARTNLTAIREPEAIVLRHFGESLACARALPQGLKTLLDFGSGAGFPGALCALARPEIAVTLAESQGKKAAFLAEVVRSLGLQAQVLAARVEMLPAATRFDAVTLRAVDKMESACLEARGRVLPGGWLVLMTTQQQLRAVAPQVPGIAWRAPIPLPGTEQSVVALGRALAS